MSHDPMYTKGGIAAFRCFWVDPSGAGDGFLKSLASLYWWKAGPQEADGIPERGGGSGFWGFKTLPEAIYQEGATDDLLVFALTEHWGKMVEHETGLRSQFAEIVAFIEPVRPAQLAAFPREALARNYPDVPVNYQREIAAKIQKLGMVTLPRAAPYPLMQWLGPDGALEWTPETIGPPVKNVEEYEMLPAAATYPDETHPADQRLRKVRFQESEGDEYVFWGLVGAEEAEVFKSAPLMRSRGATMYRHRIEPELGEEAPDEQA